LIAIVLFVVGWRTRIVTPIVLALFVYHWLLYLSAFNTAYDRLNLIFLVVLSFTDLDAVWSIRAVDQRGEPRVTAWAQRLLGLQLALLYFGAGLWKLTNPSWHSGNVIEFNTIGPYGTWLSFWLAGAGTPSWAYAIVAWSVIIFELLAGFALYSRRGRKYVIAIGTVFHLANWTLLFIPEFLHCALLYVLFVEPETLRRLGEGASRVLGTSAGHFASGSR